MAAKKAVNKADLLGYSTDGQDMWGVEANDAATVGKPQGNGKPVGNGKPAGIIKPTGAISPRRPQSTSSWVAPRRADGRRFGFHRGLPASIAHRSSAKRGRGMPCVLVLVE